MRASSILALSLCSTPAFADCAPDPTVAGGTTTCTGVDSNGLNVPTSGTRVNVDPGAVVKPGPNAASITLANTATLDVSGTLDGGAVAGLLVTNGAPYYAPYDPYSGVSVPQPGGPAPGTLVLVYPGSSATLRVEDGGAITGATGIVLSMRADNATGMVNLTIENTGTIAGTGGTAILAKAGTTISSIGNGASGTIGAISGNIGAIINQGLIDGGSRSAVAGGASNQIGNDPGATITTKSTMATLNLQKGTVYNSATIANLGQGPAIAAKGLLYVTNYATGAISSAGSTAILAGGKLQLDNLGTITGSVDGRGSTQDSMIDTSAGKIDGDVLFGSGNDTFNGGAYDPATASSPT